MVNIPEYKRDEALDYLYILKSLNEIPFPVGKNLLADFLIGDYTNNSIKKNSLNELNNFGKLAILDKNKILATIENLILNGLISESPFSLNKFLKILSITKKGQEELIEPKLNSKKVSENYIQEKTDISDKEILAFKELSDFLTNYNLEQKKAIISSKEKILCIAGAGTGKTSVLTKRIEFLNKLKKVKTSEILAITFTKKAKEEMEKRLENLGIKTNVQTFNSFCERILLKYGGKIYGRKVRIAGYGEKMTGLIKALENISLNLEEAINLYFSDNQKKNKTIYELQNMFMNDCYSVLDYYRITKQNPEDFLKKQINFSPLGKMICDIVLELEKYLKTFGLRTYSDQLIDTLDFFKKYPKLIPSYEHVLVDEFQDVNSKQVELLNFLNPKNLFCVGDPRQSIFGWRGSDVNYILNFRKDYPDSEIINLTKNYRSNSHIVKFMNNSITEMKMPELIFDFEGNKNIKLYNFPSEEKEYEFVLRKILSLDVKRNEIFVLARTNKQLIELSNLLKNKGILHILKNENNENVSAKENEITLSTIHSIKGLEAEVVFIVGCGQNNFPSKSNDHPILEMIKMYEYDREEEERRLFYVGISRAKNHLYLTYSGKKHTYFINKDMLEDLDFLKFD